MESMGLQFRALSEHGALGREVVGMEMTRWRRKMVELVE